MFCPAVTTQQPAPDALAPPPGNPRFPLFDGLRAVAALSILATHTAGLTGFNAHNAVLGPITARLNVGVAVFFVISGFLLYRPFVAARMEARPAPAVRRYARRRALRILPAYWLALTVLAIWPGLTGVFTGDWWAYYGLLANLRPAWLVSGLGPAWSLCIELAFYALLPLYAWVAARWLAGRAPTRQLRGELIALAVLATASVTARTVVHVVAPDTVFGWTLSGTFLWFALGMGLAVASAALAHRPAAQAPAPVALIARRPLVPWAAALGVLLALSFSGLLPRVPPYEYSELGWLAEHLAFAAFGFLLVLPAVFGDDRGGLPRRLLGSRSMAWLGLVSYGIFLWHLPLAIEIQQAGVAEWVPEGGYLVVTALSAAAAIACAAASYYLVERPILRFKDPRPPRRASMARRPPVSEGLRTAD